MDTPARIAVITGAGSGIGAATSLALAAEGWFVALAGRRAGPLVALAEQEGAGRLRPVPTDVTDEEAVRALFREVLGVYGRVDLLFNNAGAFGEPHELDALPLAEWDRVVAVNLTASFLCTREAFSVMRRQLPPGGRIINNGSVSAHTPRPRSAAYTATKHALTGLTKATSLDGRPYGITCGQLDIGNAETSMTQPMAQGALQADGSIRPEPHMAVEDVARAVVYMAGLPLEATVAQLTVHATGMPYVGRG